MPEQILRACCGMLKSLHLDGDRLHRRHVDAIAAHCAGLEILDMRHIVLTAPFDAVWPRLGPTLRGLSLWRLSLVDRTNPRRWLDFTGGIVAYCGRLDFLELVDARLAQGSSLLGLLRLIGARMKVLSFPGRFSLLTKAGMREMVLLCPQVKFDICVDLDDYDVLETLGRRVRKMTIMARFGSLRDIGRVFARVEILGRALKSVEHIDVLVYQYENTGELLMKLLLVPKPCLREMVFRTRYPANAIGYIFDALADAVSTLVVLRFLDMIVTARDIERLVAANPKLITVEVDFHDNTLRRALQGDEEEFDSESEETEEGEEYEYVEAMEEMEGKRVSDEAEWSKAAEVVAVNFVAVFRRCDALKEMVISNRTLNTSPRSKRISESCSAFHGKDVDIFVGGVQYIP